MNVSKEVYDLYSIPDKEPLSALFENIADRLYMLKHSVASVTLTIKTRDGHALKKLAVDGILDKDGETAKTNDSGIVHGYVSAGTKTLSITNYADIEDWSKQYTFVQEETYSDSVTLNTRTYLQIASSKYIKMTTNVRNTNISVSGAGASGNKGSYNTGDTYGVYGGSGGNAGQSIVSKNVNIIAGEQYRVEIGGSGGNSSFGDKITALGGSSYTKNGTGGRGAYAYFTFSGTNTNYLGYSAANGSAGTEQYYSDYETLSPCGGGGGGGGACYRNDSDVNSKGYSAGGGPNGGSGGAAPNSTTSNNGENGVTPAGGGGGGGNAAEPYLTNKQQSSGGAGGKGLVCLSMELYFS